MDGFGYEDGAGDGEIILRRYKGRGAEVGGCADAFEDGGEGDEALYVGEGKIVSTRFERISLADTAI